MSRAGAERGRRLQRGFGGRRRRSVLSAAGVEGRLAQSGPAQRASDGRAAAKDPRSGRVSRWNDGFDQEDRFTHSKRSVIPLGIRWIQIADQNRFLSASPYGRPAKEEEWEPWHWMRDSGDGNLRFLWDRMRATRRADCSDAGMVYFLVTGDERSEIWKLRNLLRDKRIPEPVELREHIRLEAENFRELDGWELQYRNDRGVSHGIGVRLASAGSGRIETPFDELYAPPRGRYSVGVRFLAEASGVVRFSLLVNGARQGPSWTAASEGGGWETHTVREVTIHRGDGIRVEVEAGSVRR